MLKDAALVQLDLLLAALDQELVLKDSTPYNVQFRGAKPLFVDIGSYERLRDGEPWVGYRQFCMLYLYPLLLQAAKGAPFHPWLRGSIDGITPAQMRSVMSFRDRFRKGVFTNVFLHAKLEQRYSGKPKQTKADIKRAGFKKEIIVANVRKMRKLVDRAVLGSARGRLDRLRRGQQLHRRRRPPQGRVRARGGHLARVGPRLGRRRQQRPLLAHRRRGREDRRRRRRRPGTGRAALPRPPQGGQRADPDADDEPRRPVARARLARPRAQDDGRARQARPGARARGHPPRRDERQRAGQGVRRLARLARQRARDRVPHARGPDGPAAARAQARRACTPTTRSGSSSAASARRSRSSAPSGCSPARACSTTRARRGHEHRRGRAAGRGRGVVSPGAPGDGQGGALGAAQPRGAMDVRGRPAAVRPAQGQPRVLRRARLLGLGRDQLLGAAGGAGAAAAARDRAAARPARPPRARRARTSSSSACWSH